MVCPLTVFSPTRGDDHFPFPIHNCSAGKEAVCVHIVFAGKMFFVYGVNPGTSHLWQGLDSPFRTELSTLTLAIYQVSVRTDGFARLDNDQISNYNFYITHLDDLSVPDDIAVSD